MSRRIITKKFSLTQSIDPENVNERSSGLSKIATRQKRSSQRNTPTLEAISQHDVTQNVDQYSDKLVKYIPADVIAAWLAAKGMILTAAEVPTSTILWTSFSVGVVLTFFWTLRQTNIKGYKPAYTQSLIATAAFVIWVMAMGQPFELSTLYSSLLLILFSLVVPLINPPEN